MNAGADYQALNNYNFASIAHNYMMRTKITSAHGTNYIAAILSTVGEKLHPNVEAYIMRWVNIFTRYDQPEKADVKTTDTKKKAAPVDTSIFDL